MHALARVYFFSKVELGSASVLVAEALVLRDSVVKAKEKGFTRVEVEGDHKLVIEAVNGRIEPP